MPEFPPGVHLQGGRTAAIVHTAAAREFYSQIIPVVVDLRRQGLSLRAIARDLDRRGIPTRSQYPGQRWNATQIRRVLARAGALEPYKPHIDAPDKAKASAPHGD